MGTFGTYIWISRQLNVSLHEYAFQIFKLSSLQDLSSCPFRSPFSLPVAARLFSRLPLLPFAFSLCLIVSWRLPEAFEGATKLKCITRFAARPPSAAEDLPLFLLQPRAPTQKCLVFWFVCHGFPPSSVSGRTLVYSAAPVPNKDVVCSAACVHSQAYAPASQGCLAMDKCYLFRCQSRTMFYHWCVVVFDASCQQSEQDDDGFKESGFVL